MSNDHQKVEALKREFEAEALDLIGIAERAGDSRQEAISWTADDWRIGKIFDEIKAAGGFEETTTETRPS